MGKRAVLMPRRVDKNQPQIVKDCRALGMTVLHLHEVGKGCPDIAVGWRGKNALIEIKSEGGELTPDEKEFFAMWRGQRGIAYNVQDVVDIFERMEDNS